MPTRLLDLESAADDVLDAYGYEDDYNHTRLAEACRYYVALFDAFIAEQEKP